MVIVFALVLSVLGALVSIFIEKKLKIPFFLNLIIIGILFQVFNLQNQVKLMDFMNTYTQSFSIVMIYFMAGYSLNLKNIDNKPFKIASYPSISSIIILTIIFAVTLSLFVSVNLLMLLVITFTVALIVAGTPILFVPVYQRMVAKGKSDEQTNEIFNGYVLDQIPTFLVITVSIILGMNLVANNGSGFLSIVTSLIVSVIVMVLGTFASYWISKQITKLAIGKLNSYLLIIILILVGFALPTFVPFFKGMFLFTGTGCGIGFARFSEKERFETCKASFFKIILFFGYPIMFISLGLGIDLGELFNVKILIATFLIYIIATLIKGFVFKNVLLKMNYNKENIKKGLLFVVLTGQGYINVAITFSGQLDMIGYGFLSNYLINMGITIYLFSIIISPIIEENISIIGKIYRIND